MIGAEAVDVFRPRLMVQIVEYLSLQKWRAADVLGNIRAVPNRGHQASHDSQ